MPFPTGAVVAGASALISAIIAAQSSKKQANRINQANLSQQFMANQANLELAKYQSEANQKFIDAQNAYNSPRMQQSRFAQAGLNPNLMYGQGTPGTQNSPNRYEAPTIQPGRISQTFNPLQIPQVIGMYQDFRMKEAQIDNIEANTSNLGERTKTEPIKRIVQAIMGKKGEFDIERGKSLLPYEQDIAHGKSQEAYSRVLQEMNKVKQQAESLKGTELRNDLMKMDMLFKQYEKQWREIGIEKSDNIMLRVLVRMMSAYGLSPTEFFGN
ncbi:MAG: DNA pilot protein [Microvirus sp.]|nr:MAG: DNA pilot protein [Microvirus sp.]